MKNNVQKIEKTATEIALRYLSRRQITVFKLTERLRDKGFSSEEIDEAINKLIEWKYLDDHSYAIAYIKYKGDKYSKKKIMIELLKAGIDREQAITLLEEFYPGDREYHNCKQLAEKIWKEENSKWDRNNNNRQKNVTPKEIFLKKKVGEKLLLRGFPYSLVIEIATQISQRENF